MKEIPIFAQKSGNFLTNIYHNQRNQNIHFQTEGNFGCKKYANLGAISSAHFNQIGIYIWRK